MIYTSPYGKLPIPEGKSVWDFLELHASSENARAPAFICGITSREVSFSQMFTQAKQIVAGLHANGIKKGDVRRCSGQFAQGGFALLAGGLSVCVCFVS